MTKRALDKFYTTIQPGQVVEAVHGGERHAFLVERIEPLSGTDYLYGRILIRVPAAATRRRLDLTAADVQEVTHRTEHRSDVHLREAGLKGPSEAIPGTDAGEQLTTIEHSSRKAR